MSRVLGLLFVVLLAGLGVFVLGSTWRNDSSDARAREAELERAGVRNPAPTDLPEKREPNRSARQGVDDPANAGSASGAVSAAKTLVHGRVVTGVDTGSVPGAIVHLAVALEGQRLQYLARTTSGGRGRFRFGSEAVRRFRTEEWESAEMVLFATCPGFVPGEVISGSFELGSDDDDDEVLIDLERGATWSGRVLDAGGAAVGGAVVRLDTDAGDLMETFTDPDGVYGLAPPADYPLVVSASAVGLGSARLRLAKRPELDSLPDLVLGGAALTGQIVLTNGDPVGGRRVAFERLPNDGERDDLASIESGIVTTDAEGRFRIAGVRPGRYELVLTVPVAEERERDLPLPRVATTGGRPVRFVLQRVVVRAVAPAAASLDRIELDFAASARPRILDLFRRGKLTTAEWGDAQFFGYSFADPWTNRDYEVLVPVGAMLMIRVTDAVHGLARELVEVRGGSTAQRVDVRFASGQVPFRFSLVGANGKTVRFEQLRILSQAGFEVGASVRGEAFAGRLPAGRYRFFASTGGTTAYWETDSGAPLPAVYLPVAHPVELRGDREQDVRVQLTRGGRVRLELVGPKASDGRRANDYALVGKHMETGEFVHLTGFTSMLPGGGRRPGVYFNRTLYGLDVLRPGPWRFELRSRASGTSGTSVRTGKVVPGRYCELRFEVTPRVP